MLRRDQMEICRRDITVAHDRIGANALAVRERDRSRQPTCIDIDGRDLGAEPKIAAEL